MGLAHVQAVIVGAGAGGGVVAKELATAGLRVVLLERGKWYSAADCRKDDLRNQRTTVLGNGFGPEEEGNPRVLVDERGEHIVAPSDGGYSNNAACVGGGTFSYGAMAWRYLEKDFRMRSTYGAVAGSTLEDWPISYADLAPYYEKAEWEMGVSGDDTNNIFRGSVTGRCRCRRSRRTRSTSCSVRRRNGWACIRSTFPCCATRCRTMDADRACAAAGVWGSPAKWTRAPARTTPSSLRLWPPETVNCAPGA